MNTASPQITNKRSRYCPSFKRQMAQLALRPDESAWSVAQSQNLNIHTLRKWISHYRQEVNSFVPVELTDNQVTIEDQVQPKISAQPQPPQPQSKVAHLQIERGELRIQAELHGNQAEQIGLILREVLR